MLVGATAGVVFLFRPECPPQTAPPKAVAQVPRASSRAADVERNAQPDAGIARTFAVRRNLFAFVIPIAVEREESGRWERITRPDSSPSPRLGMTAREHIGRFGPDANPIAVFAGNGDIVDARVGDLLAGEFRLSAIGIESADVTSASGVVQRVALRP